MSEQIEKPVVYITNDSVKSTLWDFISKEPPFEITDEMMEKVANEFKWLISETVSNEIDAFWDNYEKILDDAVWNTLYGYALEQIGETFNENVWKRFKKEKKKDNEENE